MMHESNGKFYGTVPVILSRVEGPDGTRGDGTRNGGRYTVYVIGYKSPYGGVSAEINGKHVEQRVEWFEAQGWTVTVDRLLDKVMGWGDQS